MKELYDKLSSYNIFNYLLPGILFCIISIDFCGYNFLQEDIFKGAFLYYFVGMIISRIGSIFIEPFLKFVKFLKFADYKDFVNASKKDDKIELFSEINNSYRTLISMLCLLLLLNLYSLLNNNGEMSTDKSYYLLIGLLLIIFLFSYRKQTNYISKRIKANL